MQGHGLVSDKRPSLDLKRIQGHGLIHLPVLFSILKERGPLSNKAIYMVWSSEGIGRPYKGL